jgi:hypothetical protein
MSDHFDLLDFQAPDPSMAALDITGLYVFAAPHDRSRTVLILAVNPFALGPIFDPDASYRFDIDADGDLTSDLAYNVQFTGTEPGRQLARVTRALGGDARSRAALGNVLFDSAETSAWESVSVAESMGYRFFAGPRSDPFFADADGLFNGYQFTGVDSFSDKDVFAIALEVPNDDLGPGPVAVWGSTISRADGRSAQVDRTGGSNLMNFLTYGTPDEIKPYREADPSADLRRFGPRYTRILVGLGYTAAEAKTVVEGLLPDVLHYDHRMPGTFPNGRALSDDLADLAVSLMTQGRITTDGVGPHDDYATAFPHLGAPHRRTP